MWVIDAIGTINPKVLMGLFILVALDYSTKWVEEVASYSNLTKTQVTHFIKKNCLLILPSSVHYFRQCRKSQECITDDLCRQFKIFHRNTKSFRLYMNEAVEDDGHV